MVINSAKKSNTSKTHSNGNSEDGVLLIPEYDKYVEIRKKNYEKGDLIFPSKKVYKLIKSIDKYLRLLYAEGEESINHSNVRDDEKYFDEILGRAEECIERIKIIDDWFINDLYKEKYAFSFLKKFKGIYHCYKEYKSLIEKYGCMEFEFGNNFERRIVEIKMGLSYMGIDLFYD